MNKDNDKIKLLNISGKNEDLAAIENLKRNFPAVVEHVKIFAKMRKASYDAHIKEGFTKDQALELCKKLIG